MWHLELLEMKAEAVVVALLALRTKNWRVQETVENQRFLQRHLRSVTLSPALDVYGIAVAAA